MIDYQGFAFAKPRPKALDKAEQDAQRDALDKKENAKARKRAEGQCEVMTRWDWPGTWGRCPKKDTQTHHLIGGIGRRNRGKSILSEYKLRVCTDCHDLITKNILQPTTAEPTALTVRYRRAR